MTPPQLAAEIEVFRSEGQAVEVIQDGARFLVVFKAFELPDGCYAPVTTDLMVPTDEAGIDARLAAGDGVVVQFPSDTVRPEDLAGVDALCARHDARLERRSVRFLGSFRAVA